MSEQTSFTKSLTDISRNDVGSAGGKGAALGDMVQAGIPVPSGFVVTAQAFDEFLQANGLHDDLQNGLAQLTFDDEAAIADFSRAIQNRIGVAELADTLQAEIGDQLAAGGGTEFAVRSSATAEDGAAAAWAGQLESYLYINPRDVAENVQKVWASLFSSRAVAYRLKLFSIDTPIVIAVVVQQMIEAEFSGVAFTVDPMTNDNSRMIVEACYGDCELLVAGEVIPDHYVLDTQSGSVIEAEIGAQIEMQRHGRRQAVPENERAKRKVSDEQLAQLAAICKGIEKHFGKPQDIEWAYDGQNWYVLQARPITTLVSKVTIAATIKPQDYAILFRLKDKANFFQNRFLLEGGLKFGNPLIVNRDGAWTFYLRKDKLADLGKRGLELLADQDTFIEYEAAFSDYLSNAENNLIPKWQARNDIKSEDIDEFVNDLAPLWKYYAYTEFVYHDYAYEQAQTMQGGAKDKILKNIDVLVAIKDRGRSVFNAYAMKDGLVNHVLRQAEARHDLDEGQAGYLTIDEFKDMLAGKAFDLEPSLQRHKAYVLDCRPGETKFLADSEAVTIAEAFYQYEQELNSAAAEEIHGTVASPGVALGKVVISPMLDRAAAEEVAARMADGDILVAQSTNPNLMILCEKAGAIVTDQGGMLSHAAIISREMGKPCIVGTTNATKVLQEGELVEVDATSGIVRRLGAAKA